MLYNAQYYEKLRRTAGQSADVVVPMVYEWFRPTSVIDVGCGKGSWLKRFRDLGVGRLCGIDGPWLKNEVEGDLEGIELVFQDLNNDLKIEGDFDVALCLEVAEHLDTNEAERLVRNLTTLAPVVIFSAAIPDQGGRGHVNEKWQSWWKALFDKMGYRTLDPIRPRIWQNAQVAYYYAQNILVYVRSEEVCVHRDLSVEGYNMPLDVVHPVRYNSLTSGGLWGCVRSWLSDVVGSKLRSAWESVG